MARSAGHDSEPSSLLTGQVDSGLGGKMPGSAYWSVNLLPGWGRNAARKINLRTGRWTATSGMLSPPSEWPRTTTSSSWPASAATTTSA
jgi:hypothetical protein